MKKSLLITMLGVLVAGMTFAQSEETRSLSSFTEISAHEGIDVYIKQGNKEEARVVSDNIDLEDVLTEVSGDRLKIHLEGNNHRNVDVKVYVTYKSLNAISASSAASLESEGSIDAGGNDFDVDVSSAGDIRAEIENADEVTIDASSAGDAELRIEANEIEADVSSAGDIEVEGIVKKQDVEVSSSGNYDGYELDSDEAEVSASSGGSIKVNVSTKLDARASSGGTIRYKGSPTYLDANSSSGGSVRKS
ncbi:Putative auto-transporter adhesin, head GIN domain [Ekhidna lutea]|uniref:Putative auto-transporter adhesin, head GIN domain n=1 Tax=Ekhidna lutea TaxID=447679 RepID=A0A239LYN7_EKHLU|nr:head GIN domain-containing protein [Ekhidna lutea]SNT34913.1 Putative auto-transporter adhesin, head GIN domain [Ekhidna lutea]